MKRTAVQPKGVAKPAGHYSHGIVAEDARRTLYVAGQVSLDESGKLAGAGDIEAQTRQVMRNIQRVVEAAGGRMEDVAKTTVFTTKLEYRGPIGKVRQEFFKADPPGNTFLVISSLADPGFLVEIEAIVPLP